MSETIQYTGAPRMTEHGRDVMAFHLHRYLRSWLKQSQLPSLLISVGFERRALASADFELTGEGCGSIEVVWTMEDLCHIWRQEDGLLRVEPPGHHAPVIYQLVALVDAPHRSAQYNGLTPGNLLGLAEASTPETSGVLLGFALVENSYDLAAETLSQLSEQACEAIRAARRNAMRLFFDEKQSLPVKSFLYQLMDHLPEWVGCDHSASILMTSNLEAMTLEASSEARFDFLAERLFQDELAPQPRRLVGMTLTLADGAAGFVRAAVQQQVREPETAYQLFTRDPEDPEVWSAEPEFSPRPLNQLLAGAERGLQNKWLGFHSCDERSDEGMYIFVPMLSLRDLDVEHLGFLVLVSKEQYPVARSTAELFEELGEKLSAQLRYSPLYTLSARKLWVLEQTRLALENTIQSAEKNRAARVERLIGEVTEQIVRHVDVPSLAIAYLVDQTAKKGQNRRHLRYAHPHGWTRFEQLNLPVDVEPGERLDSGVSSLAVRINRPLVLAGGYGQGENFAFKNYLYVHEDSGVVLDARSTLARGVEDSRGWVRLSDYYKPARQSAYATLAFPIAFGGRTLGVLTVEVERDTNWQWWTGFGARLFWTLVANELAYAFHALGVGEPADDPP